MGETARDEQYFFQLYGLKAEAPATLNKALTQAIRSMQRSVYSESARELTTAELEVLESSGADTHEHPDLPDPMGDYATEFAAILETSLSTSAAAKRLGVHSVRIRQLIGDGSLYAVQIDGRWRIPAFQFGRKKLVPNIAEVNAVIDREFDAVSVLRWYTTPDPELETSDGEILSPLAWLERGLPADRVVPIAREL
jgi:excisionase family DNA binding protein